MNKKTQKIIQFFALFSIVMLHPPMESRVWAEEHRVYVGFSVLSPQATLQRKSDERQITMHSQQPIFGITYEYYIWKNFIALGLVYNYSQLEGTDTIDSLTVTHQIDQERIEARLGINIPLVLSPETGVRPTKGYSADIFFNIFGLPLSNKINYSFSTSGEINRESETYTGKKDTEKNTFKNYGIRITFPSFTVDASINDRKGADEIHFTDGETYTLSRSLTTVISIGFRF